MSRNELIAKIHILKNSVKLDDDVYRSILVRVTGKETCAGLEMRQLLAVIEEFNNLYFIEQQPKHPTYKDNSKFEFVETSCSQMRLIFALWKSLEKAGKLDNPSNAGLDSFLKKRFNASIEELNKSQLTFVKSKVITALKNWEERA